MAAIMATPRTTAQDTVKDSASHLLPFTVARRACVLAGGHVGQMFFQTPYVGYLALD